MTDTATESPKSTKAIVTFIVLAIFACTIAAVFGLVYLQVKVQDSMLSLLGTVIAAVIGGAGIAWGSWLNTSAASQKKDNALVQLAGAGAQSPATPGTGVDPNATPAQTAEGTAP